jgi:hypothetical protein
MNANEENIPRKGDKLNGWTVDYTGEMVWLVGRSEGIPLVNVAPTNQPGVWTLVGIESTEDTGEEG